MHGWSKGGIMMIMTEGESGSAVQRESEADEWFWIHKRRPISVEKCYCLLQLIQLQNFEWIQHQWYESMREQVWWRGGWSRWLRLSCMDGWVHRWVKGERWNCRDIVGTSEEINERRKEEERAMMKLWGTKTDECIMMLGCRRWKSAVDYD